MTLKEFNKIVCEGLVTGFLVEIKNVPFETEGESYPRKRESGHWDLLLECNPSTGRPFVAYTNKSQIGSSFWNKYFSKKTIKEINQICKKEVKELKKKLDEKINIKKYKWFRP